jgi:cell wall-associated NlpC family hydrolase
MIMIRSLIGMTGTCLLALCLLAPAASARPHDDGSALGNSILDTAESRAGDWYSYGSAGPGAFDCSGLVYWAAAQHGIDVPRTTYGMLAGSAHLVRIPLADAQRGDLLFYGSGHVEFKTIWPLTSFGAHHSGTTVGWVRWWPGGWEPTMAMRFV